ncbi:MAG TPA: hypothetical protein VKV26_10485 [Dehalococcoidia bacterium]|nr:hypothetical protein [Dehalococcoidia bacterium]
MNQFAQVEAGLRPGAAAGRVDGDALHLREIDHEAAVDRGGTGSAVAAAAHGDGQGVSAGEADRLPNVPHLGIC